MAGGQGFEPRLLGPEPSVLPLDDPPAVCLLLILHTRPVKVNGQRQTLRPHSRANACSAELEITPSRMIRIPSSTGSTTVEGFPPGVGPRSITRSAACRTSGAIIVTVSAAGYPARFALVAQIQPLQASARAFAAQRGGIRTPILPDLPEINRDTVRFGRNSTVRLPGQKASMRATIH